jgi:NAD(P)-dependent dehydrogenase (short-subunit alcohol dehydrogenase family)
MQELQGRTALVSGGGRGIGRGISEVLAGAGARVAVNYHRDRGAADETVTAILEAGGDARAFQASVGDRGELAAMVEAVDDWAGPVDLLVNNAGVASKGKAVADTDPAEPGHLLAVHAIGPHWLSALVLPGMRRVAAQAGRRGDIVFISSVATDHMAGWGAPYNMGKAAMEALARTLAKEEVRHNVHVNIVAPGLVVSEMGRRLARATRGVGDIHELDATFPFGHVCTPEEVAEVVRFFCGPGGAYVTGQRVGVDGGGQPR